MNQVEIQADLNTEAKKVKYDLNFILSPALAEEALANELARMRTMIESKGGVIFESEMPKLRPLAYPVVKSWAGKKLKFDQGQFGWFKCEIESSAIAELTREIEKLEPLIKLSVTYAYTDVRPVRRAFGGEIKLDAVSDTTDVQTRVAPGVLFSTGSSSVQSTKDGSKEAKEIQPAPDLPKSEINEAELDKQIDNLLV